MQIWKLEIKSFNFLEIYLEIASIYTLINLKALSLGISGILAHSVSKQAIEMPFCSKHIYFL